MPAVFTSPQGLVVPALLYGTAWKKERTAALVAQALGLGFRGIDTACQPKHYDEPGVGTGIAAARTRGLRREQLYLQTKFTSLSGQDPRSVPYDARASLPDQVRESCRVSLGNLQTSYLDCLVLHSPIPAFTKTLEAWQAMEGLVDSGSVRALGISNCYEPSTLRALWQAARIKPLIVQNRFYPKTGHDREIRDFCRQHAMFYQSFWTLTANPQLLAHPTLRALAARHAFTPAQLLFRCLTQLGMVVLSGTTSTTHMQQDLAIFELELTEEELAPIRALFT
jgi:diketogulonate reductase-like aldo/keto reductase